MDLCSEADDGEIIELLDDDKIVKDDFVLVKFLTKKWTLYYVGKILQLLKNKGLQITALKKCKQGSCHMNI